MQGLCNANSLIFKDENLHCDFAIHLLNNHVQNKPSEKRIKEIFLYFKKACYQKIIKTINNKC